MARAILGVLLVTASFGCGSAPPVRSESGDPPLEVTIERVRATTEDESLRASEAEIIAADVRRRREGEHGRLPPVERAGEAQPDAWPTVSIRNDTPHNLLVWFAGPCPRTLALAPQGEHVAELCEGRYDIAAQLSAPDFLPFVGEGDELENGNAYRLTFYVVAQPSTRGRRGRR